MHRLAKLLGHEKHIPKPKRIPKFADKPEFSGGAAHDALKKLSETSVRKFGGELYYIAKELANEKKAGSRGQPTVVRVTKAVDLLLAEHPELREELKHSAATNQLVRYCDRLEKILRGVEP